MFGIHNKQGFINYLEFLKNFGNRKRVKCSNTLLIKLDQQLKVGIKNFFIHVINRN